MSASEKKPVQREIELDFIRGIAVLLVVHAHTVNLGAFTNPHFDTGPFGVFAFFILSGFLVGGILIREWDRFGRVDTFRFLSRRGFKIWPQYYCFLIVTLVSGHRNFHTLWGNFLNIQNYVGGVAHTWSLAVEEHAYLLLTFVMVFCARLRTSRTKLLCGFITAAVILALYRDTMVIRGVDVFARTEYRIDGILWGMILAMLLQWFPRQFHKLRGMRPLWVAGLMIAPLAMLLTNYTKKPFYFFYDAANFFGVSVLMLLYSGNKNNKRSLPYRAVAWIGLYSYGIYLWHVSVIVPVWHLSSVLPIALPRVLIRFFSAVIGIAVGIAATEVLELPMLRVRDRLLPRKVASPLEVGVKEVKSEGSSVLAS